MPMEFEQFSQEQKLDRAMLVTDEDSEIDTETLLLPGKPRIELYDVVSTPSSDHTTRTITGKNVATDEIVAITTHLDIERAEFRIVDVTIDGETVYDIRN